MEPRNVRQSPAKIEARYLVVRQGSLPGNTADQMKGGESPDTKEGERETSDSGQILSSINFVIQQNCKICHLYGTSVNIIFNGLSLVI